MSSFRTIARILALGALLRAPCAFAEVELLEPFRATYGVEWRGMGAGTSTLSLERARNPEGDIWTYSSRITARGVFRIAFPQAITQTSVFRVTDGTVVPLSYRADDGSKSTARDISLEFDWAEQRVTGTAEDRKVEAALKPGTQDALSVQIALMRQLARGDPPERFVLFDKDELKEYEYTREGSAQVATGVGELETVVYRSSRAGSRRVTRLWLAPGLGFLPARAQQLRGDRVEFTMQLRGVVKG